MKAGALADDVGVVSEVVGAATEDVFEMPDVTEDAVGHRCTQQEPERFNGLQFRCTRWQTVQNDVGWHFQFLGDMPAGIVENNHQDLFSMRIRSGGKLRQRLSYQVGFDSRQEQTKHAAGFRLGEIINIQPVVLGLAVVLRPMTALGPNASTRRLQAQPGFILRPHFNLFLGMILTEGPHPAFQGFFSTPDVPRAWPSSDDSDVALAR